MNMGLMTLMSNKFAVSRPWRWGGGGAPLFARVVGDARPAGGRVERPAAAVEFAPVQAVILHDSVDLHLVNSKN